MQKHHEKEGVGWGGVGLELARGNFTGADLA